MDGSNAQAARAEFEAELAALRPKLHRYCARMTGTVFDGEDALQDALGKAIQAFDGGFRPERLEAWLVRVAHNAAIDLLRRRARRDQFATAEAAEQVADPDPTPEARMIAAAGLRAFLALPVVQRSSVILMDVLGYSTEEIADMLQATQPAVKAALNRGRARLREAAAALEAGAPPALSPAQRGLYDAYVEHFNARDFDAIREMLAEEVWLEMVAKTRMKGPEEIGRIYLKNYGLADDWRMSVGVVDGRPALVVHDPAEASGRIAYFVELEWTGERLTHIRDFRYARYVTEGAEAHVLP